MGLDFWNDAERRTKEAESREKTYLGSHDGLRPGGSSAAFDAGQQRYADKTAPQNIYGENVAADRRRQQIGITDLDMAYKRAQQAATGNDRYSIEAANRARQQYNDSVRGGTALAASVPMAQRAIAERRRQMEAANGQTLNENAIASARAAYMSQAQDRMAEIAKARMEANLANTGGYGNELAEQARQNADRRLFYTQMQEDRARAGEAGQINAANAWYDSQRQADVGAEQEDAQKAEAAAMMVARIASDPSKKGRVFAQAASRLTSGSARCR